ncbi:MAG: c-type cytochrome [Acidobacteria bacterium]|nr:c-type cytochrome [Acidobacteriota bacterium]
MNRNKILLLASSIGVLALLAAAAINENFLKDWRRIQSVGHSPDGAINVQLRQVVNPGLRTADRCTSCHVSMGPGEQEVTGHALFRKHPAVVHDPAQYGCTICHGGQGSATEKADAHGDVHFWPEPMIPLKSAQAGCGTCHIALHVPKADQLRAAQAVFERLDCRACHRVDGKGGTIRPDGGGMEGTDLTRSGVSGYDMGWYAKHVEKSAKAASGPWKTSWAAVNDEDLAAVAVFLASRNGAPKLMEAKATFFSYGCLGCHRVSGVGGDEGPDLTRAGEKDPGQADFSNVPEERGLNHWIAEHFRAPVALVTGSKMPAVAAPESDIAQLTTFVLSLRRRELPGIYSPKDRLEAVRFGKREFAGDGATLFGAFCAGCHGQDGMGRTAGDETFPAIANAEFQKLASDRFLTETIAKGRPGRRMPGWNKDGGLRPDEVAAIVRHLRVLSGVEARAAEDEWKASRDLRPAGRRLYAASCGGCHGADGQGNKGPALANAVLLDVATDGYLRDTITKGRPGSIMPAFGEPSPTHRTLAAADVEAVVAYIRSWQEKTKNEKKR